jgi:hypothetical protein
MNRRDFLRVLGAVAALTVLGVALGIPDFPPRREAYLGFDAGFDVHFERRHRSW